MAGFSWIPWNSWRILFGFEQILADFVQQHSGLLTVSQVFYTPIMGDSLNDGTPQNTPKWSFLVGKPMVVGYHHFRKPPYLRKQGKMDPLTFEDVFCSWKFWWCSILQWVLVLPAQVLLHHVKQAPINHLKGLGALSMILVCYNWNNLPILGFGVSNF